MDVWRLIAERKVEEAMADGAFTNLQGAGAPLRLDEDPFVDPSLRMAHRLLRNNGFAPAWILEGKEIDAAIDALRREIRTGRAGGPDSIRKKIGELNAWIATFNLKTPSSVWHKLPLNPDREIFLEGIR